MLLSTGESTLDRYSISEIKKFNNIENNVDVFIENLFLNNIKPDRVIISHCDGVYTIHRGINILETIYNSNKIKVKKAQIEVIEFNFVNYDEEDEKFINNYLKGSKCQ